MTDMLTFEREGYLHLTNALPPEQCDLLLDSFRNEVKPDPRPMLRQRSVTYQPHRITRCGYVENALLDVHRTDLYEQRHFASSVQKLLSSPTLQYFLQGVLGPNPTLVQSMYFETCKGTPDHFDCYFITVPAIRCMTGAWIALESIAPDAGAFYVYPGSQDHQFTQHVNAPALQQMLADYTHYAKLAIHGHQADSQRSVARAAINCKRVLEELIDAAGWRKVAPPMQKGDAILFSSGILHGSHMPKSEASRNSLTAHFIDHSQTSVRYGAVTEKVEVEEIAPLRIHLSSRYRYQDLSQH
jgi:phytanoyl-CoA hydroxylase